MDTDLITMDKVREQSEELVDVYAQQVKDLTISSNEGLELAGDIKTHIKKQTEVIKGAFRPHIQNAHKVWKDLLASEKEQLEPFEKVLATLKPMVLQYKNELARREREEAEKRERQERERVAEEKKKAQEARDKEVEALMEKGDFDKAEMVEVAPIPEPVATYTPPPPKNTIKGVGTRTVWKAKMINFNLVGDEFKDFNQSRADKYANAMKDKAKHPGIEFYQEERFTGR